MALLELIEIEPVVKGIPCLNISRKSRSFYLNKEAGDLLNLRAGDCIGFVHEKDSPDNIYIYKSNNAKYRVRKRHDFGFTFYSKALIEELMEKLEVTNQYVSCRISTNPIQQNGILLFGLLTHRK